MEAFAGESQARNKYTYFASKARKDGYEQIAAIFEETANNEKSTLSCGSSILRAEKSRIPCRTSRQLPRARTTSGPTCTTAWPRRLRRKRFKEIAAKFRGVRAIEKLHEERYRKLLKNIEDAIVFSRDGDSIWVCRNCGHVVVGPKCSEDVPGLQPPAELLRAEGRELLERYLLIPVKTIYSIVMRMNRIVTVIRNQMVTRRKSGRSLFLFLFL